MADMESILKAARKKLLANAEFAALIGTDVGQDDSGSFTDGWVFFGVGDSAAPMRNPANTGLSTVSFNMRDPWSSPNLHNTLSFRLLRFSVLSDMTRIAGKPGLIGTRDAEFRCDRITKAIVKTFNDVGNVDHHWPDGVFIVSSVLYHEPIIRDVINEDGLVEGDFSFALELS